MAQSLAPEAPAPASGAPLASTSPPDVSKLSSVKGLLLILAGIVVGGAGYSYSYTHTSPLGTLVGMLGIALCILGTAKAEGPVHR